jgi:1-acyl-sn-glycerol-3-phosphate acyltransferase
MNRQPYCKPPRWWEPKLHPLWVRVSRAYRWRQLRVGQQIVEIDCRNADVMKRAVDDGKGVLITPNHSAHYDSAALYVAADRVDQPLYFMTAWQVFGMSNAFEKWAMQRLGCFSIDREGNDRQAFKQAIQVLQNEPHPLVIFPEGDIYHTADYVTPFREGAVAIAMSAAKRAERPVEIFPCGVKFTYIDDPTEQLLELTARLEERLYLRIGSNMPLPERIHRLAEAALALKELDYFGFTEKGRVRDRIQGLIERILVRVEKRHDLPSQGNTPERVKALRQKIIERAAKSNSENVSDPNTGNPDTGNPDTGDDTSNSESASPTLSVDRASPSVLLDDSKSTFESDMTDLFFVMQLYSYRGDYLLGDPSIERIAETLDKFEEDILGLDLPTVRGRRRVAMKFGDPIELPKGKQPREKIAQTTVQLQQTVQGLIDELNQSNQTRH